MTDTLQLELEIKKNGYSKSEIASMLGLSLNKSMKNTQNKLLRQLFLVPD